MSYHDPGLIYDGEQMKIMKKRFKRLVYLLCQRPLIVLVIGVLLTGITIPVYAEDVTGPGFTSLGIVQAYSQSDITSFESLDGGNDKKYGINFILSTSNNRLGLCSAALPNVLTPDGQFYGWELSPYSGVYGVIYDSSILAYSLTANYANKIYTTSTWSANGKASDGLGGVKNCYTPDKANFPQATAWFRNGENTLSGQLNYGVYIDSTNPKAGNYNLDFYLGKFSGVYTHVSVPLTVTLTSCTVNTPTQVNFGNISAGSTTPVVSADGGLNVVCAGAPPTVNILYSAQFISPLVSPTTLSMSNNEGVKMGNVRGFIGTNAENDVGCTDKNTSMDFNGTTLPLLVGANNNSSLNIPLKWVLCPDARPGVGEGAASVMLNIIWK